LNTKILKTNKHSLFVLIFKVFLLFPKSLIFLITGRKNQNSGCGEKRRRKPLSLWHYTSNPIKRENTLPKIHAAILHFSLFHFFSSYDRLF